ncbi:MAG TPA: pyruvate kinase alpha/beta domain-containing protein [Deltaproteobacteria bacterium]|nr:pyruvate kinase alpha/beta domain-containing protein [Deltaproteobacteria bacterium]
MKMVEMMLFERPGNQNTADCVKLVAKHVKEHGRKHVVVASTSGKTAMAFHKALQNNGANLVVVTHSVGFKEPGHDEFDPDLRRQLKKARVPIHTGTILTHSLEKSIMDSFRGIYPGYLIANTLRRFGEGTKVAMEIVMEAYDAGLIPENEEVLGIGGTYRGSDTVLLIKSKPSKRFLELDVLEILARPRGRGD